MAVYIVGHIDIEDRMGYAEYEAGFAEVFSAHKGEVLAVDDEPLTLEGEGRGNRCVILRFPDRAAALAWYNSPEYQRLAAIRWNASSALITLVEGREQGSKA